VAGAAVQWLRDGLGIIGKAADVEALAASVPDSGGVVFVPALAGLGAPHWRPGARGLLAGLTRGTTRAHVARAVLESIALQNVDVLSAMAEDAGRAVTELRVDGGASTNDLLMQLQADVLGVRCVRPKVLETTALGAAYLAGLGVGLFGSTDELAKKWEEDRAFSPRMSAADASVLRRRYADAVRKA
jgi:glycerol kinase